MIPRSEGTRTFSTIKTRAFKAGIDGGGGGHRGGGNDDNATLFTELYVFGCDATATFTTDRASPAGAGALLGCGPRSLGAILRLTMEDARLESEARVAAVALAKALAPQYLSAPLLGASDSPAEPGCMPHQAAQSMGALLLPAVIESPEPLAAAVSELGSRKRWGRALSGTLLSCFGAAPRTGS
ncbi:hypothetical protein HYH03_014730 [Edaphochlamys debaryana]|uniref:Uncharacterized protein n=1 Tax=Edaphochlamys debaryana TaxID=47281 RepID=A0A835XVF3_9CHLO|nr:hypothetical protein HYH03_014730 [Edaphochlamys debaryana]|eukprot:KAG2486559.1 hypothetical protein HYH03_014730 [Edaphochlamys debaryana]